MEDTGTSACAARTSIRAGMEYNRTCKMVLGNIEISQADIADLCRRYHIQKLALFGSVLGNHFGQDSDVDVLVEFDPAHVPGFLGLARIERELSALFAGRKVDVRTPGDLSRYFRDEVIASARIQYEAR